MTKPEISLGFNNLCLQDAFKNFYIVPDYQREYVWEERNVGQLLEDIHSEYKGNRNKEYFIGSTVVYKNDEGYFELIDGQQRTTTLFLIIASFKKRYAEFGEKTSAIERFLFDAKFDSFGREQNVCKLELQYRDSHNILSAIIGGEILPNKLTGSAKKIM